MRREKISCDVYIDPDDLATLVIKPQGDLAFKENSLYEFKIPAVTMADGTVLGSQTVTYITEPAPTYVTLDEILSLASGLDLKERNVLFHLREASRVADYWIKKNNEKSHSIEQIVLDRATIKEEYFSMYMFVKHKALYECLKEYYIEAVTRPYSIKDQLSDLSREEVYDLKSIKTLLDQAKLEYEDWLNNIVTIAADPKWALRGKFAMPINISNNYGQYHKTNLNGFNRGY